MNKKRDVLDINGLSDTIKLNRFVVHSECKAKVLEVVGEDGKVISKRNAVTVVDEKVADSILQIFQGTEIANGINYKEIKKSVSEKLEPKFKEAGLVVLDGMSKKEILEINKKRSIATEKHIREYIVDNFNMSFKVNFDDFIKLTGVKTASRFGKALDMVLGIQEKQFFEWKQETISDDFKEIKWELLRVSLVPKISIVLNTDEFSSISEFQKSKKRNKKKYIDYIEISLNRDYIATMIGLGRDFALSDRKIRNKFSSSYTFRLDWIIRTAINARHNPNLTTFTIAELQKIFGTNYTIERQFLDCVIYPSIEEINKYSELNVEVQLIKEKNKIKAVYFKIEKNEREDLRYGVEKVAYYIASRLYYFSDEKIHNLIAFGFHIESNVKTSLFSMFGGREYNDWKEEAEVAYSDEAEVIRLIEENKHFFEMEDIIYSKKKLCILKNAQNKQFKNREKKNGINSGNSNSSDFESDIYEGSEIKVVYETPEKKEQVDRVVLIDRKYDTLENDDYCSDLDEAIQEVFGSSENNNSNSDATQNQPQKTHNENTKEVSQKENKTAQKDEFEYVCFNDGSKITNPIESLRYLKQLLIKKEQSLLKEMEQISIVEMMPFSIFIEEKEDGVNYWRSIATIDDYREFEKTIVFYISAKKSNYFLFHDEVRKEQFLYNLLNENFIEHDESLLNEMIKILG